jgi:hypothetical protein
MKSRPLLLLALAALVLGLLLTAPDNVSALPEAAIIAKMSEVNEQLAARGEDFRLVRVDYFTAFDEVGQTVYFDDRDRQAGEHWVPNDDRRWEVGEITGCPTRWTAQPMVRRLTKRKAL